MTSFIRLDPPLEMESNDFGEIKNWLAQKEVQHAVGAARGWPRFVPLGCRVLSFRGHDVTLICFGAKETGSLIFSLWIARRCRI